jgi:hypothetical protein
MSSSSGASAAIDWEYAWLAQLIKLSDEQLLALIGLVEINPDITPNEIARLDDKLLLTGKNYELADKKVREVLYDAVISFCKFSETVTKELGLNWNIPEKLVALARYFKISLAPIYLIAPKPTIIAFGLLHLRKKFKEFCQDHKPLNFNGPGQWGYLTDDGKYKEDHWQRGDVTIVLIPSIDYVYTKKVQGIGIEKKSSIIPSRSTAIFVSTSRKIRVQDLANKCRRQVVDVVQIRFTDQANQIFEVMSRLTDATIEDTSNSIRFRLGNDLPRQISSLTVEGKP